MVEPGHKTLSIRRQCALLDVARGSWYYEPATETPENLTLMRRIDELYLKRPYFGSRRLADELNVNREPVPSRAVVSGRSQTTVPANWDCGNRGIMRSWPLSRHWDVGITINTSHYEWGHSFQGMSPVQLARCL